jgi:hypothetical protein
VSFYKKGFFVKESRFCSSLFFAFAFACASTSTQLPLLLQSSADACSATVALLNDVSNSFLATKLVDRNKPTPRGV